MLAQDVESIGRGLRHVGGQRIAGSERLRREVRAKSRRGLVKALVAAPDPVLDGGRVAHGPHSLELVEGDREVACLLVAERLREERARRRDGVGIGRGGNLSRRARRRENDAGEARRREGGSPGRTGHFRGEPTGPARWKQSW